MADFPILKTNRLTLRQITAADQQHIFYGLSHPEVIPYYGVSYGTYEATQEQMDWYASLQKNKTGIWWAVTLTEDNSFLGAGGFNDWNHVFQKAEIGFWLLPEYWGKGFMKEGMDALAEYAFSKMNLHRIEGYVDPDNVKCIRGLAKLGYTFEGTMRDCEKKNNQFVSYSVYSKLSSD